VLIIHIIAGSLVLLFGYFALLAPKGLRPHRLAGSVFVVTMIFSSLSAAYLEYQLGEFPIMGTLSLYFVITSWSIIKQEAGTVGAFEYGAFITIAAVAATFYKWGWDIVYNGKVLEGTLPLEGYFILGSFAAMAALLDLNMIIRKGLKGSHRIARHLWRMCFALLLPTLSFLDQDIFPDVIKGTLLLWSPIIVLILMMIFWLCRLSFTQWSKAKTALY